MNFHWNQYLVNALKWIVTNCSQGYYLCTWVWWKISLLNHQLKWKVASIQIKLKVQSVWYTYYVWLNYICWKDSIFRIKEFEDDYFLQKNSGYDSYAPCDMRLGVRIGVWPIVCSIWLLSIPKSISHFQAKPIMKVWISTCFKVPPLLNKIFHTR
jgi:hypothetical protein